MKSIKKKDKKNKATNKIYICTIYSKPPIIDTLSSLLGARVPHSLSSCVSEELLGSVGSSSSMVTSNEERFPRLVVVGGGMQLADSDRLSPPSSRV